MRQSTAKPIRHEITPAQGLGYFPLSDIQYDVINVISEKSKALQAYDKYLRDCVPNPELFEVFERIKADDRKHINELRRFLPST